MKVEGTVGILGQIDFAPFRCNERRKKLRKRLSELGVPIRHGLFNKLPRHPV